MCVRPDITCFLMSHVGDCVCVSERTRVTTAAQWDLVHSLKATLQGSDTWERG